MVSQTRKTWYAFGVLLDSRPRKVWSVAKKALLLFLFVACELRTVEAAPVSTKSGKINVNIVSKSGLHLTINKQGITGEHAYSSYAELEMHSVGYNGEVTIRGVKTGKYLTMDSAGNVSLATSQTKDAVFIIGTQALPTLFRFFQSKLYPSKYLAISGTGAVSSRKKKSDNTLFALLSTT